MKLLWIEDHAEGFRELISRLKAQGIRLFFASTEDEVRNADLDEYDNFIVDNKIGKNSRLGQSVVDRLKNKKNKRTLFHTAYLPPKVRARQVIVDARRNNAVGFLEKDLPDFDRIGEFWDDLSQKIGNFFTSDDPRDSLQDIAEDQNEFERISQMSLDEFEVELKSVGEQNRQAISSAFEEGAVMVIVSSDDDREVEIFTDNDHLPDANELVSKYGSEGIFPYVFRSDFRFDDLDCHSANRKDRVRDYPHAVLVFGDQECPIHFDTGADTSIFSEAFVNEVGNARIVNPVPFGLWLHRTEHVAKEIALTSVLKNPERVQGEKGPGHSVDVPGLIVSSWTTSDLQIRCSSTCQNPTGDRDMCVYRSRGLLGRDLYVKNHLRVTLSSSDSRIEVAEDN